MRVSEDGGREHIHVLRFQKLNTVRVRLAVPVSGDFHYICYVRLAKLLLFHRRGAIAASMTLLAIMVNLGSAPVGVFCKTPWPIYSHGRWCLKHGLPAVGACSNWAACPLS